MANDLNGSTPVPPSPQSPVVQLLENALAQAKAGQISSLAIVSVGHQGQLATSFCGGRNGDMYVGCSLLQKGLLDTIMAPAQAPGGSRLWRPGMSVK